MKPQPKPDRISGITTPKEIKDRFKCFFHIKTRINGKLFSFPLCHEDPHNPELQSKGEEILKILSENKIICGERHINSYDVITFPDMSEKEPNVFTHEIEKIKE